MSQIMSWSNDTAIEFLELYKREPIIWDRTHTDHRNRSELTGAWNRISDSMSIICTVPELKKKKESLMTTFRMQCKKAKQLGGSYVTNWFAYELMRSFLGGKYECENTDEVENEFFEDDCKYDQSLGTTIIDQQQVPENPRQVKKVIPKAEKLRVIKTRKSSGSPIDPLSSSEAQYSHYETEEKDKSITYLKRENSERNMDECDLYCRLLAKKLRKLEESQRDIVMHDIDNLVFRTKMEGAAQRYTSMPVEQRRVKSPMYKIYAHQSTGDPTHYEEINVVYEPPNQTESTP